MTIFSVSTDLFIVAVNVYVTIIALHLEGTEVTDEELFTSRLSIAMSI